MFAGGISSSHAFRDWLSRARSIGGVLLVLPTCCSRGLRDDLVNRIGGEIRRRLDHRYGGRDSQPVHYRSGRFAGRARRIVAFWASDS